MNVDKTIEQKWNAVLSHCEEVCNSEHRFKGVIVVRGETSFRMYVKDGSPQPRSIFVLYKFRDVELEIVELFYSMLGLAERDAVAKEREIAEEYLSRLKAERARNTALLAALDVLANHISNTQFMYKLYLESKDGTNSFNLSKSIGELGRAKTKCKKEFLDASSTEQGDQSND